MKEQKTARSAVIFENWRCEGPPKRSIPLRDQKMEAVFVLITFRSQDPCHDDGGDAGNGKRAQAGSVEHAQNNSTICAFAVETVVNRRSFLGITTLIFKTADCAH